MVLMCSVQYAIIKCMIHFSMLSVESVDIHSVWECKASGVSMSVVFASLKSLNRCKGMMNRLVHMNGRSLCLTNFQSLVCVLRILLGSLHPLGWQQEAQSQQLRVLPLQPFRVLRTAQAMFFVGTVRARPKQLNQPVLRLLKHQYRHRQHRLENVG